MNHRFCRAVAWSLIMWLNHPILFGLAVGVIFWTWLLWPWTFGKP